jgi:hypothetical protein
MLPSQYNFVLYTNILLRILWYRNLRMYLHLLASHHMLLSLKNRGWYNCATCSSHNFYAFFSCCCFLSMLFCYIFHSMCFMSKKNCKTHTLKMISVTYHSYGSLNDKKFLFFPMSIKKLCYHWIFMSTDICDN